LGDIAHQFRAFAESHAAPGIHCLLAYLESRIGRPDAARETIDRLAAAGLASLPRQGSWVHGMGLLAEAGVAGDARERAADVHALLAPYADQWVVLGGGGICTGPVAFYLGMLERVIGRGDDAVAHLTAALDATRAQLLTPLVAKVDRELAAASR